jgi:hypothetical protein
MKRTWGVSVYLGIKNIEQDIDYIKLAHKYGFTKIFTCFLGLTTENKAEYLLNLEKFMKVAVQLNYKVYIDVNPTIFKILDIEFNQLEIFEYLNMSGIRLDEGFSGLEESIMSHNPKLELFINASTGTKYLDNILSYEPNKYNIIGCHNFYPRRYSGLSSSHFIATTQYFKSHNIRVGAFVNSQNKNTFSNQSMMEGLPTLEAHRDIPIVNQVKELFLIYDIDDIIIGNSYASEEELRQIYELNKYTLNLKIDLIPELDSFYNEMLFDNLHFNRGDVSEYMIRSTMLRIKYKHFDIKPLNVKNIEVGDITIDNNDYKKYKGELHIAIKSMKNDGNVNVIGKVNKLDIPLLKAIKPWTKFVFVK